MPVNNGASLLTRHLPIANFAPSKNQKSKVFRFLRNFPQVKLFFFSKFSIDTRQATKISNARVLLLFEKENNDSTNKLIVLPNLTIDSHSRFFAIF